MNPKHLRFRPERAQTTGKVERPVRYVRGNFIYGRDFIGDEDVDEQRLRWLRDTANVRLHQTTGERPIDRFDRDERPQLRPLAEKPYRSLILSPAEAKVGRSVMPQITVERRSLSAYARIAAGAE